MRDFAIRLSTAVVLAPIFAFAWIVFALLFLVMFLGATLWWIGGGK
jgi:hypothetical protein